MGLRVCQMRQVLCMEIQNYPNLQTFFHSNFKFGVYNDYMLERNLVYLCHASFFSSHASLPTLSESCFHAL